MDDELYLEAQYSVEFSENGTHFGEVYEGSFGDFNGEFQEPFSEFQVLILIFWPLHTVCITFSGQYLRQDLKNLVAYVPTKNNLKLQNLSTLPY